MPRGSRAKSETGFYHVVMRGAGHQVLFETDEDRAYFLTKVQRLIAEEAIELHAFALMDNHFHLLVRDCENSLERFIRRLATAYSLHFNSVYGHVGHVFQGRYLSEPVDSEAHYLTVLRYIVQNPVHAGLGEDKKRAWTSYALHFGEGDHCFLEKSFLRGFFLDADELKAFLDELSFDTCLDVPLPKLGDGELNREICRIAQVDSPLQVKTLGRPARDAALRGIMGLNVSERRVERATGIPRSVIRHVVGRV